MSETRIINRTPETFGQRLENERLEEEKAKLSQTETKTCLTCDVPVTYVGGTLKNESGSFHVCEETLAEKTKLSQTEGAGQRVFFKYSELPKYVEKIQGVTAEAHNAPLTGKVELEAQDAEDAIASILANSTPLVSSAGTILQGLRAPRDPDLVKFKLQVIAAFKHLGLDTRRFFD
jgi:hypothetical protein